MQPFKEVLEEQLDSREKAHRLRRLRYSTDLIDFCSNDYLGFARSADLKNMSLMAWERMENAGNGATGARLLSGNLAYTEETEAVIAKFHRSEAALIFNSGYDANLGLLSSLAQRGDTLICDELIHASLIDGSRLSHAHRLKFKHNDLTDLEKKLKLGKGNLFVIVESIYSMDGDQAPLQEISQLCQQYQAHLIVDEAHATGVFGAYGVGLVAHLGLEEKVFARVVTFGKALGCHGAAVLSAGIVRSYLINFARSFIYTTALAPYQIAVIRTAYHLLQKEDFSIQIQSLISTFRASAQNKGIPLLPSNSCVQGVLFSDEPSAHKAASHLQLQGFDVRPIVSPTVPIGKERLRICLHLFNTPNEIERLTDALQTLS